MKSKYGEYNRFVYKLLRLITIIILVSTSIFTFNNIFNINISTASERSNEWEIILNITEPDGASDSLIFGEKIEAYDGKDQFDLPKPPAPQAPYIYSWFTTSLDSPYNILWKDYRKYSDNEKIWNLTIIWASDTSFQTNITISWDTLELAGSGYGTVNLLVPSIVDMTIETNYQFIANSNEPYNFQINLKNKTFKKDSNTNEQIYLYIIIFVIVITIITFIAIYLNKIKNEFK